MFVQEGSEKNLASHDIRNRKNFNYVRNLNQKLLIFFLRLKDLCARTIIIQVQLYFDIVCSARKLCNLVNFLELQ